MRNIDEKQIVCKSDRLRKEKSGKMSKVSLPKLKLKKITSNKLKHKYKNKHDLGTLK